MVTGENSKLEIRSPKQISNINNQPKTKTSSGFVFRFLKIVSGFDLRISDFTSPRLSLRRFILLLHSRLSFAS